MKSGLEGARRRVNWPELALIALMAIVLDILWHSPFIYPLRFFSVLVHECSHAIAGILTGGTVTGIDLRAETGGLTYIHGGDPLIYGSAGYLGSILFGSLFLYLSRFRRQAAVWCMLTGLLLAGMTVSFVSLVGDLFGFVYGIVSGLLIAFVGWRFPRSAPYFMKFLGVSVSLFGFLDIQYNLFSGPTSLAHSDAGLLAQITGLPAMAWAMLWLVISGATFLFFGYLSTTTRQARTPASRTGLAGKRHAH